MIECKNLCFSYGENEIIHNFSARFEAGERVCIKGESGIGKTTLLRLLCSLEKPESGLILPDGSPRFGVPGSSLAFAVEFAIIEVQKY